MTDCSKPGRIRLRRQQRDGAMADGGRGFVVVMEVAKQGPHLGILGKIDEGCVAAGNEEAGIALGTGCQHLPQGEHLAGAKQPSTTAPMRTISLRVATKVLGSTGVCRQRAGSLGVTGVRV